MVVLQGLRLCLLGLAGGVLAALALTRLLASQLFGVSPADPADLSGAGGGDPDGGGGRQSGAGAAGDAHRPDGGAARGLVGGLARG